MIVTEIAWYGKYKYRSLRIAMSLLTGAIYGMVMVGFSFLLILLIGLPILLMPEFQETTFFFLLILGVCLFVTFWGIAYSYKTSYKNPAWSLYLFLDSYRTVLRRLHRLEEKGKINTKKADKLFNKRDELETFANDEFCMSSRTLIQLARILVPEFQMEVSD